MENEAPEARATRPVLEELPPKGGHVKNGRPPLRIFRLLIVNLAVLVLLVGLLEGFSSLGLFAYSFLSDPLPLARAHTRYDPELGWVSRPDQDIPDMYGSGIGLRTNSQGFRNDRDFDPSVPPGRLRLVCSGDSVTLGHGVANEDSWCAQLARIDPRFETVNMGQGGYGIDQAYLWYRRDSARMDVDVHLLAFITDDYRRMQYDGYAGFGRPVMDLERGQLVVRNVPVPRSSYYMPWLATLRSRLSELRFVEAAGRLRSQPADAPDSAEPGTLERHTQQVAAALFRELQRFNQEKRRHTVLAYLPGLQDLDPNEDASASWMAFTEEQSSRLGVPLINLLDDFRGLSLAESQDYFLDDFHLSEAGNAFVAERIRARLLRDPAVRNRLDGRGRMDHEGSEPG